MNCFPCCGPQKNKQSNSKREHGSTTQQEVPSASKAPGNNFYVHICMHAWF